MISDVERSKMSKWQFYVWIALYILVTPIRWIYPYIPVVISREKYDKLVNDLAVRNSVLADYRRLISLHREYFAELKRRDREKRSLKKTNGTLLQAEKKVTI